MFSAVGAITNMPLGGICSAPAFCIMGSGDDAVLVLKNYIPTCELLIPNQNVRPYLPIGP